MKKRFAIIEIGSTNTKTHVYEAGKEIFGKSETIEFKKNYKESKRVIESDLEKLYKIIDRAKEYTDNVHIYGCSIFRNITEEELKKINNIIKDKYGYEVEVVSQEDEAYYTALGCYAGIDYKDNLCVFIGGGGSIELIFVNKSKIVGRKFFDFGVVDITNKFPGLKEDHASCTFDEVYNYVDGLVGDINFNADALVLAGGDHFYWYNNAQYELIDNTIYKDANQPSMLTVEMSDKYDRDALVTSLDAIRQRSDNPVWFDGSRAMKVITNLISHKINAKYIIPTKLNMENGIVYSLNKK